MKKHHAAGFIFAGLALAVILSSAISRDIALFAGFIVIIAGLIYSDRESVKLEGIMIMRRTKKGRDIIDAVAKRFEGFWRKISIVGIVLAVVLMIFGALLLASQAYLVATGAKEGGVKLLLPGPVAAPVNAPGVFVVPWWIWVIGIAVVIVPHEFMHGIMCRIDKVRIKSVGWLLLVVIPGAFVEPDEKQLQKQKKLTKLRVYAAGSFANMIVAFIVIVIFTTILTPMLAPAGVFAVATEGGAAYNASINGTITGIDGQAIRTPSDISAILSQHRPGDTVVVRTANTIAAVPAISWGNILSPESYALIGNETHEYSVVLAKNETGGAYLGVAVVAQAAVASSPETFSLISTVLLWIFIFSFGIGLVNMLPINPLDGGLVLGELVGNRKITKIISTTMIILLLFNLIGPIFL